MRLNLQHYMDVITTKLSAEHETATFAKPVLAVRCFLSVVLFVTFVNRLLLVYLSNLLFFLQKYFRFQLGLPLSDFHKQKLRLL